MIKILFFAQIRELIGAPSIVLNLAPITVADLIIELSVKGDNWHYALQENTPLCAVNQQLVDRSYLIKSSDEVAFFPPVTGG